MDELITFEMRFGARELRDHAARSPSSVGDLTMPIEAVDLSVVAVAEVYQGRWLARCPFAYAGEKCGGAEYVNMTEPLFFCCECRNAAVRAHVIRVQVPADRADIEATLLERPTRYEMNYLAGETVDELIEQTVVLRKLPEPIVVDYTLMDGETP